MLAKDTYAENIREAVGKRKLREVASALGYSYETVRKVYKGESLPGDVLNMDLCRYLGLPEDEMMKLANREKAAARFGTEVVPQMEDAISRELIDLWSQLDPDQRQAVVYTAKGFLAMQQQQQHAGHF